MITLIGAVRISENEVDVLYYHNIFHKKFIIEWNNIDPETEELSEYALVANCISGNSDLNKTVYNAIIDAETDSNENLELYLALRDTFNAIDCKNMIR